MTMIKITLPDELAQRAHTAGLPSDAAIQDMREEAMRRRAGRTFLDFARQFEAAKIAPMTEEEIKAEVDAVRAERRGSTDAGRS